MTMPDHLPPPYAVIKRSSGRVSGTPPHWWPAVLFIATACVGLTPPWESLKENQDGASDSPRAIFLETGTANRDSRIAETSRTDAFGGAGGSDIPGSRADALWSGIEGGVDAPTGNDTPAVVEVGALDAAGDVPFAVDGQKSDLRSDLAITDSPITGGAGGSIIDALADGATGGRGGGGATRSGGTTGIGGTIGSGGTTRSGGTTGNCPILGAGTAGIPAPAGFGAYCFVTCWDLTETGVSGFSDRILTINGTTIPCALAADGGGECTIPSGLKKDFSTYPTSGAYVFNISAGSFQWPTNHWSGTAKDCK
jgi:hypothetical protein